MDIFLLEDDSAIGIGLSYSLKNEGYGVTVAKTVKEALKVIKEKSFSLYILDLTLPDGSGSTSALKLKNRVICPLFF